MANTDTFTWLHLTDFHFGLQGQKILWPNLRQPFLEDLKKLHATTGPWNAVLFSGDLVQSGKNEEFQHMEKHMLQEIWQTLELLGSGDAVLLTVPGNHDLARPSAESDDPALDALLRKGEFSLIEEKFWSGPSGAYRAPITTAFANYESWMSSAKWVPNEKLKKGKLPGDFSISLKSAGGKAIGVIGLNTTFLQLAGGNYKGHLSWNTCQLDAVCVDGIDHWIKQHDACLLMTHQGPDWLTPDALHHGNSEIVPAGRFAVHLYGHEHETNVLNLKKGGSSNSTRLCQSRSAFGMEKFGEPPTITRNHGFVVGRFRFSDNKPFIRFWPRTATNKPDGWRFIPDNQSCILESDGGTEEELVSGIKGPDNPEQTPPATLLNSQIISLVKATDPKIIQEKIDKLRTRPCILESQHSYIRRNEAQKFQTLLRERKPAWLIADWQMGKEGFLADSINAVGGSNSLKHIYRLDCGSASSMHEMIDTAETQLGLSFFEFAETVKNLEGATLIFEDVPSLVSQKQDKLRELIQRMDSILLFSPKIRIILVSRLTPINTAPECIIRLLPFAITDTREYVRHHSIQKPSLLSTESLERIQIWTGGVPAAIDRLLQRTENLTLQQILGEGDGHKLIDEVEPVPQSLIDAVNDLEKSNFDTSQRSFKLLKLLTVLKDGETFESIRRLYPKKPFHQTNITQLTQLSLIESIEIFQTATDLSPRLRRYTHGKAEQPRLLRIPPQVRDYLSNRITLEERSQILNSALEAFFGRKWQDGNIKLRPAIHNAYQRSSIAGPGNELVIIQFLLDRSIEGGRSERINKHAKLAVDYCERLYEECRYRDVEIAGDIIMQLLDGGVHDVWWLEAAFKYAKALRMTKQREDAVRVLNLCLERGKDILINSFKASINLNLALAYKAMNEKERAIAAAAVTIELEHKDSAEVLQAKAIIAEVSLSGDKQKNVLLGLYNEARNRSHTIAANNIALELARSSNSQPEALKYLDDVIKSAKDPYNRARGISDKASLLRRTGKLDKLSYEEEDLLCAAYSYSYTQRMNSLIEECHEALWSMYNIKNLLAPLFRLFRYTSFFRLLCGNEEEDKTLVLELSVKKENLGPQDLEVIPLEIQYFELRRSALHLEKVIDI